MLSTQPDGPVLFVTLDRPEVRNAFNDSLIAALTEVFVGLDPGVRAVVLQGSGKVFSAGGDLEWMKKAAKYSKDENVRDAVRLSGLFESIVRSHAVVIAKVHGAAFGGGCGLVAASDIAIAEENTKFAFSEVKLGLIPATISQIVIPKIGSGNARSLFTTGEPFDAHRAQRIGLVHEVVSGSELDSAVEEKLGHVLASGPNAVRVAKMVAVDGPFDTERSATMLAEARASEEGVEGVAAFLDKRQASFVERR